MHPDDTPNKYPLKPNEIGIDRKAVEDILLHYEAVQSRSRSPKTLDSYVIPVHLVDALQAAYNRSLTTDIQVAFRVEQSEDGTVRVDDEQRPELGGGMM